MKIFIFILILFFFVGCSYKIKSLKNSDFFLDNIYLKDEIYYFKAKKDSNSKAVYQPLQRFDLIFVGHDRKNSNKKFKNLANLIPGKYTHVFMYIGKDKDGFAYAIEMNADKNRTFKIDDNGITVGGRLYLFCLGSDFNKNSCSNYNYAYGLKSYDFMWARRLNDGIINNPDKLLQSIKNDYENRLPFQIPLKISLKTKESKTIFLVNEGREDGASCAEYFVSLFEDVLGICINDVRVNAKDLQKYYTSDTFGKKAYIPIKYNIFFNKKIYLKELFTTFGYKLENNHPINMKCGKRVGIVIPNLLFYKLKDINIVKIR